MASRWDQKKCPRCKKTKPWEAFKRRSKGKQPWRVSPWCVACDKTKQKKPLSAEELGWLAQVKENI
jgi:hypothetical protein